MASEEQKRLLTQKLFRSIKSKQRSSTCPITKDIVPEKNISNEISESTTSKEHEQELTKRAIAEICRDTEKAAKRAEEMGPSAYRMKTTKTNKRFLANTMRSVISHNQRTTDKHATQSKMKFDELNKRKPKFGERLHSFRSDDERLTKKQKPNT